MTDAVSKAVADVVEAFDAFDKVKGTQSDAEAAAGEALLEACRNLRGVWLPDIGEAVASFLRGHGVPTDKARKVAAWIVESKTLDALPGGRAGS